MRAAARGATQPPQLGDHDPARRLRGRAGRAARAGRARRRAHGLRDGEDYLVGTMIELPRACFVADRLADARRLLLVRHQRPHPDRARLLARRRRVRLRARLPRAPDPRPLAVRDDRQAAASAGSSRLAAWVGREARRGHRARRLRRARRRPGLDRVLPHGRASTTSPARPSGCRSPAWRPRRPRSRRREARTVPLGSLRSRSMRCSRASPWPGTAYRIAPDKLAGRGNWVNQFDGA